MAEYRSKICRGYEKEERRINDGDGDNDDETIIKR